MNSREHRKYKRLISTKVSLFIDVLDKEMRPMIKEECLNDFNEIVEGLKESQDYIKTHRRQPEERWPTDLEE